MKTFVLVVLIIGASIYVDADLSDERKQKLRADSRACIGETGVNPELVKNARQGNFSDDEKLKKFAFCMAKKVGFQNKAGEFQTDIIREKLTQAIDDPNAANKLIDLCLIKGDTPENTAYAVFECYYKNSPKRISVL